MIFCMFEIRKLKLKDKNKANNESLLNKWLNKLSCFKNNYASLNLDRFLFLLKAKLNLNPIKKIKRQEETNKMNGYYYDYKYGAGGFYLKAGLACKIIIFSFL
jgi:hypothetical protein